MDSCLCEIKFNPLKQVEVSKKKIAKERDKLRDIYSALEGLINSCNTGIVNIENGMYDIESEIDSLSQYL